jgi:hypothetical protein
MFIFFSGKLVCYEIFTVQYLYTALELDLWWALELDLWWALELDPTGGYKLTSNFYHQPTFPEKLKLENEKLCKELLKIWCWFNTRSFPVYQFELYTN